MINRMFFPTRVAVFLLLLLLCAESRVAAAEDDFTAELRMVTGHYAGTYVAFGKDIAALAERNGLHVTVVQSGGSIDNIKRIADADRNSDDAAEIGIVQSDVLSFLRRSQTQKSLSISQKLRMIIPFYSEEVHLLARREISSADELNGKRVVVGGEGSGSMLTSVNIFSILGVKPDKMYQVPPPEGIVAVLNGEVDAVIFVGGKPVRMFKNMEALAHITSGDNANKLEQVHFLPLTGDKLLREYSPSSITAKDYNYVEKDIPTVAVTAVLVTRDFSGATSKEEKEHCAQVKKLMEIIRDNIGFLKANSHSKWKEVDLTADVGSMWKRDNCTWGRDYEDMAWHWQ